MQGNNAEIKKVPPDGGWAWVIVFGYIITGITCIPIIQNFGLIYKQRLYDLGLSSTDITTIISLNSSIGQILGVFQSPLLKKFGYRWMAAFGVASFVLGTFLTGLANSFVTFVIFYGIITSIGFTYVLTSFSMAINSYFKEKRSRASGINMGCTGLGPVIMPQLVTFLLGMYGTMGTSFLLSAICAHSFIGVCLLRPVEQYMRIPEKKKILEEVQEVDLPPIKIDAESILLDAESLGGFDPKRRRSSLSSGKSRTRSVSESVDYQTTNGLVKSVQEEEQPLNRTLGSIVEVRDDVTNGMKSTLDLMNKMPAVTFASVETLDSINYYSIENLATSKSLNDPEPAERKKKKFHCVKVKTWLNEKFDLDLLKDPIYISITLGLSIAVIGELMFSILTPFILFELDMDLQTTAYFMSTIAVADIVARFGSPFIAEMIKIKSSRVMYIIALFCLLLTRASLLFVKGTVGLVFVAAGIGFAKGVRTVFWGLVLPQHVPIEKLGSAMSFQNLLNGILIFLAGPLSGAIVEINQSYLNIIYVSNAMTALTILLWTAESLVIRILKKNKERQ